MGSISERTAADKGVRGKCGKIALFRVNPWNFKVRSETIRRYGASRIPKGSRVEDWPLDYQELEQY